MDNSKMNLVNSVILSPDIHHIFPEAYCQKVGIKRQKYNSIVNKLLFYHQQIDQLEILQVNIYKLWPTKLMG